MDLRLAIAAIVLLPLLVVPFIHWQRQLLEWFSLSSMQEDVGNSFGYVEAVASFGALAAAIYAAIQATRTFRIQSRADEKRHWLSKRADDERLLLELARDFWSVEFYPRRQNAHELWHYMEKGKYRPEEASDDTKHETSRTSQAHKPSMEGTTLTGNADSTATPSKSPDADRVLSAAVEWTVVGAFPMRKKLVEAIVENPDFKEAHPETGRQNGQARIAEELIRSFFEVLNFWTLYATVLERTHKPPLDDLLGPQWHWTDEIQKNFSLHVEEYRKRCAEEGRVDFQPEPLSWQIVLEKYRQDRHPPKGTQISA